jgi:hypothetical protein
MKYKYNYILDIHSHSEKIIAIQDSGSAAEVTSSFLVAPPKSTKIT